MPRYYFEVTDGQRLVDPSGVDCANDQAAQKQAKVIATQIAADIPDQAGVRRVVVIDDEGREIAAIQIETTANQ